MVNRGELEAMLRALKLSAMAEQFAGLAERVGREGLGPEEYLWELAQLELGRRSQRRVERLRQQSGLPVGKTLQTLEVNRFGLHNRQQLERLRGGEFVRQAVNVIAVGKPGAGKTHLVAALGYELVEQGVPVLFDTTVSLVQRLLAAKRDLRLPQEMARLDRYECLILDDIGYVQQSREEMEVLFTLLAERYERKSVVITTNLVFSEWDQIFKDPMTTMAAIDRVVHHSVILDLMSVPSYRAEQAQEEAGDRQF
jgi:DNA replication protein DnaC